MSERQPPLPQTVFDDIPLDGPPLLTCEDVAGFLQFDRSTVYEMLDTGELEHLSRPGKDKAHKRITRRSFLAWSARGKDEVMAVCLYGAATLNEAGRLELLTRLEAASK